MLLAQDTSAAFPTIRIAEKSRNLGAVEGYVVIVAVVVIQQYFYATVVSYKSPYSSTTLLQSLWKLSDRIPFDNDPSSTAAMERSTSMGNGCRELKLGKTFSPQNTKTAFHTLKYDFKPASVDHSKEANVDISPNNQVTVTVPNLESSGVPNTVFKGNQKKYTKEFVLIYDKETNTMTLEKLNHNILVKKTRTEPPPNKNIVNAPAPPPPPKHMENSTQRTSSKTRVSTGGRKNTIIGFTPRSIQGSPSTTKTSPQAAPAWIANNSQSTLPSIPLIELDEDVDRGMMNPGGSMPNVLGSSYSTDYHHPAPVVQQQQLQQQHQMHQQQQQQQQLQQQQQQQYHHSNSSIQTHNNYAGSNGSMMMQESSGVPTTLAAGATRLEEEIGELSSSDSSSDSDSSGSGSDSDDSDNELPKHNPPPQQLQQQQQQQQQSQQSYVNGSALILHDDLQLSESNSSDSDDD